MVAPLARHRPLWRRGGPFSVPLLLLLSSVALALGLCLPVVDVRSGFSTEAFSVLSGIADLYRGGNVLLAGIVLAFSVLFPIVKLGTLTFLVYRPVEEERRLRQLELLNLLGRWSMLDVFVVAILIGALSLGILANAGARAGIYVFAAAILLSMLSTMRVVAWAEERAGRAAPGSLPIGDPRGRYRALVALVVLAAGLFLPLMELEKLVFWKNEYSLARGILAMWCEGEVPLALFLAIFVVLLPFARQVGLVLLRFRAAPAWVEVGARKLEKWSMLDVFVLALLVVAAKIGEAARFQPRSGFWMLLLAGGLALHDSWAVRRLRA
jgi:paraquat-inducible protein A